MLLLYLRRVYLLFFPTRRKGWKRDNSRHKLPLLYCNGCLACTTALAIRLSGTTEVLQNMGEQPREQEWNGLDPTEILFVDLLLEVK